VCRLFINILLFELHVARYNLINKKYKNNPMSYINKNTVLAGTFAVLGLCLSACQSEAQTEVKYDCSVSDTIAAVKSGAKEWSMQKASSSGSVVIDFSCTRSPFVGDFQKCHIQLKQNKKGQFADEIAIDGGMKAHGHGLPTVPTLSPGATAGYYEIEGLKYSMPGAWIVGFKVNIDGVTDQIIFDFII